MGGALIETSARKLKNETKKRNSTQDAETGKTDSGGDCGIRRSQYCRSKRACKTSNRVVCKGYSLQPVGLS